MIRKWIDIFLTLNLIGMILLLGYWWYTGVLVIEFRHNAPVVERFASEEQTIFIATLRGDVDRVLGIPDRGYEPFMFLAVFPGLVETDFANVEASTGRYVIADGRLMHKIGPDQFRHDAATAISAEGMKTLLTNVSLRTGIDLEAGGTITEIMAAISNE